MLYIREKVPIDNSCGVELVQALGVALLGDFFYVVEIQSTQPMYQVRIAKHSFISLCCHT